MKVLMLGRIGLFESGGGDKIQIENTALELRKMGVDVDIKTSLGVDVKPYDVVHIFQLDWTSEPYFYARKAKSAGKPLVLSPIHHNISEVKKFDDSYAFDFRRVSRILFKDQYHRDTFKNMYRSFFDIRKIPPTLVSVFRGLKNMHRDVLEESDVVLVQTNLEAADLKSTYGVTFDWRRIPNGVGRHFLTEAAYKNKLDVGDYIIVVGRIEPRKNQLNIIEAVKKFRERNNLDVSLVFIGTKSTRRHFEYVLRFNRELKKNRWIKYIGCVPYEEMPSYYHFAKVGVSASWFETTGLTSLEALFCNANAVASGERAKECLGAYASYCEPDNVESIIAAVAREYFAKRPSLDAATFGEYTWENAAKKTLEVYQGLVGS